MDIWKWLARSEAGLRWRKVGGKPAVETELERARVARALRPRLSPHLMRDIGMDDG